MGGGWWLSIKKKRDPLLIFSDGFTGEDDSPEGLAEVSGKCLEISQSQHMEGRDEEFRPFLIGNGQITDSYK